MSKENKKWDITLFAFGKDMTYVGATDLAHIAGGLSFKSAEGQEVITTLPYIYKYYWVKP